MIEAPWIMAPVYIVVFILLFSLWCLRVGWSALVELDKVVTAAIFDYGELRGWNQAAWWMSRLGDGWAYALLYLALQYWGFYGESHRLAGAILVSWGTVGLIKLIVRRKRSKPWGSWNRRFSWSFPSQHAATAAAMAMVVGGWEGWVFAAVVAVGRVVSGSHWVGDVVVGLVLGVAVGRWV